MPMSKKKKSVAKKKRICKEAKEMMEDPVFDVLGETKKRGRPPKVKPEAGKLTVDDFVPTKMSMVSLRSLSSEQRNAVAECCDVIKYASSEDATRGAADEIKNFFLQWSQIPKGKNSPVFTKRKTPDYIPRFDHD